jgi:hypothetical protein
MFRQFVLLAFAVGAFSIPPTPQQPTDVSIIQLIASPKAFDGKLVRVTGFVRLQFENTEIYLHREDCENALYANGLWLDLPSALKKEKGSLDMHYALIEGVFDAGNRGHNGAASGMISKIQRLEPWPDTQ